MAGWSLSGALRGRSSRPLRLPPPRARGRRHSGRRCSRASASGLLPRAPESASPSALVNASRRATSSGSAASRFRSPARIRSSRHLGLDASAQQVELPAASLPVLRSAARVQVGVDEVQLRPARKPYPHALEPLGGQAVVGAADPAGALPVGSAHRLDEILSPPAGQDREARAAADRTPAPEAARVAAFDDRLPRSSPERGVVRKVLLQQRDVVGVALVADDRKARGGIVSGHPGAETVGVVGEHRELVAGRRRGGEQQGDDQEPDRQSGSPRSDGLGSISHQAPPGPGRARGPSSRTRWAEASEGALIIVSCGQEGRHGDGTVSPGEEGETRVP